MSGYYQAAKQLEFFKGRNESGSNTDALADALALAQHHDVVSGTERQHVAADYANALQFLNLEAEGLVTSALALLVNQRLSSHKINPVTSFQQVYSHHKICFSPFLNARSHHNIEIVVYNPLAWKREEVIRIPETDFRTYLPQVSATEVFVQDSAGKEIESQLLPLSNITSSIRKKHVKAYIGTTPTGELKYWLAFLVYVPPIGFSTYIVSRPKQAGHASTISNEFRSEGSTNNNIEVGQGNLTLLYSANEGKLTQYVNIRNLIGPIPVDDGTRKEVITQFSTTMKTNKTFYTDSNGHDFIKRIRDFRTDWDLEVNQPVVGNYYPVYFIKQHLTIHTSIFILVDRSVGGSSLVDGQVELMLHRRMLHDDARGVGEILHETVCIADKCEGLIVKYISQQTNLPLLA
ncbi:hypothetical protein RYX36_001695 [Vicia faba]